MQKNISFLGCGWVGLPLAEAFVAKKYIVHGSTTSPDKLSVLAEKQIKPYLINLGSLEITPENFSFFQSELLIVNIPPRRAAGNDYALQIKSLQNVLKNSGVRKVIFVSSTSVYMTAAGIITEESSLDLTNAVSLIEAEKTISFSENPWETTIIRFAGLFGPGREPGRFLAGKINLPDPDLPVNLIHLQDCIQLIQEIIKQEKWNETFNGCADIHPSRKEFYTKAARVLNLPEPGFTNEFPSTNSGKKISNKKVKTALNYQFTFPDPLQAV